MTQWAEPSDRGRNRGPIALARAWVEVLVRPRRFFRTKVAPGDQAPGLTFAAAVVFVAEATRLATVSDAHPVFAGQPTASAALWLLAVVVLVTPAGVHLAAALQTLLLTSTVDDRAGVSETVQVICYAFAPCVFLAVPVVWVRALLVLWAASLFVLGLAIVHDAPLVRIVPVAALPALFLFGYGFGGNAAVLSTAELIVDAVVETPLDSVVNFPR